MNILVCEFGSPSTYIISQGDPSWSQAYASWAQVFVTLLIGFVACYIALLQYKSQELQRQSIASQTRLATAQENLIYKITGGSVRLSYSGYSKDSILTAHDNNDLEGVIKKIRGALRERSTELEKNQLKEYVESAFKLMDYYGSVRISYGGISKDSIKKACSDNDIDAVIDMIAEALLERIDELEKDQLEEYVESAFKVMENCDIKWNERKRSVRRS